MGIASTYPAFKPFEASFLWCVTVMALIAMILQPAGMCVGCVLNKWIAVSAQQLDFHTVFLAAQIVCVNRSLPVIAVHHAALHQHSPMLPYTALHTCITLPYIPALHCLTYLHYTMLHITQYALHYASLHCLTLIALWCCLTPALHYCITLYTIALHCLTPALHYCITLCCITLPYTCITLLHYTKPIMR